MEWVQKTVGVISLCSAAFLTYVMIVSELIYEISYLPAIIAICIILLLFSGTVFLMDGREDDSMDQD